MEKLFSYTLGNPEITIQDVDDICTTQITNKIFVEALGCPGGCINGPCISTEKSRIFIPDYFRM